MRFRGSGFTLIELLVVMLIMGLALGVVGLKIGTSPNSSGALENAEQIAREVTLFLEESQSDNRNRGLVFEESIDGRWSWRWYQQDAGLWRQEIDTGFSNLEVGTKPTLRVEGKHLSLRESTTNKAVSSPHIVVYSSGEATPFVLALRSELHSSKLPIVLCGDALGHMVLLEEAQHDATHCRSEAL